MSLYAIIEIVGRYYVLEVEMKVLFTYDYGHEAREQIRALGYQVEYFDEKNIATYEDFESVEIMACYKPFDKVDLRKFKNLKLILLSSIGIDQVPVELIEEMGIVVCNNNGGYSIPIGEWIVMKTMELMKHSKGMYSNQSKGIWQMDTGAEELYNKEILFLGTGTIAHEAAKRLQGFGVKLVGLNTTGKAKEFFHECYPISDVKSLLPRAKIVVVTLPYTKKTHRLFNKELIDLMDENSYLINIARGSIIDEPYLIKVLEEKGIKGAALDVFEEEPLPVDSRLWALENVVLTSHNCWISEKRNERRFNTIRINLENYFEDKALLNVVDLERGY